MASLDVVPDLAIGLWDWDRDWDWGRDWDRDWDGDGDWAACATCASLGTGALRNGSALRLGYASSAFANATYILGLGQLQLALTCGLRGRDHVRCRRSVLRRFGE